MDLVREVNDLKEQRRHLNDKIETLTKVAEAADRVLISLRNVYHGTPSKLQWPEWHVLRQSIEAWKNEGHQDDSGAEAQGRE